MGALRCLLDTHALLWWLWDDPQLSPLSRQIIAEPGNEILVSAVSAWEITTKHRLGRLGGVEPLLVDMAGWIRRAGFAELPIGISHALRAGSWVLDHRDPFDRMLAAQSVIEDVPLVTRDPAFEGFGIRTVW